MPLVNWAAAPLITVVPLITAEGLSGETPVVSEELDLRDYPVGSRVLVVARADAGQAYTPSVETPYEASSLDPAPVVGPIDVLVEDATVAGDDYAAAVTSFGEGSPALDDELNSTQVALLVQENRPLVRVTLTGGDTESAARVSVFALVFDLV